MKGFRSGESGGLIEGAKRTGRAIGKRREQGSPANELAVSFLSSRFPSFPVPRSAPAQSSPEGQGPFMMPLRPGREAAPDPPTLPTAVILKTDPMWREYRTFKAAGLLAEWRRRWAYYLVRPAA